jgi:hypothetical protein
MEEFIGLSKKQSQDLAERRNFIYYLIRIDDKNFFPYPQDQRNDRICIEIDKTKVTKAVLQ